MLLPDAREKLDDCRETLKAVVDKHRRAVDTYSTEDPMLIKGHVLC